MSTDPTNTLAEALDRSGIALPAEQLALLDRYCRSLWDWNEKINLTRHTSYDKFVSRDVVDSLELSKLLAKGEKVLDVGSGGGVPGVVLAILRPDLRVALSESVGKKARALESIVAEVGLKTVVHAVPAQEVLKGRRFDTLVVRAVAPLAKLLTWFAPHWKSFDGLLVIKGPAWVEERQAAREKGLLNSLSLRKLASYPLPGTHSESVVLAIRPKESPSRGR